MLSLVLVEILEAEFIKPTNQLDINREREIIWITYAPTFQKGTVYEEA